MPVPVPELAGQLTVTWTPGEQVTLRQDRISHKQGTGHCSASSWRRDGIKDREPKKAQETAYNVLCSCLSCLAQGAATVAQTMHRALVWPGAELPGRLHTCEGNCFEVASAARQTWVTHPVRMRKSLFRPGWSKSWQAAAM